MIPYVDVCREIITDLSNNYDVPEIDIIWDTFNYFSSYDECIAVNEEDAERFEDVFRKIVSDIDAAANEFSVHLLSFLHEVGHWMDEDELYNSFDYQVMLEVVANMDNEDEGANYYMRSPAEWVATKWAVDFVTSHLGTARKYDKWFKEAS